jgi:WD40 repeat protein
MVGATPEAGGRATMLRARGIAPTFALSVTLLLACGARPLRSAGAPRESTPVGRDAGDPATSDAVAGDRATGDAGQDATGLRPDLGGRPWGASTTTPFSCNPLPSSFLFAAPSPDVIGVYARCASFGVGRALQVAVSPDGARVALVTDDGIVRVVDVASRTVIGVLASPRAYPRRAAFSPSGDAILTIGANEREATLWRAADWTPAWTVALPGRRYSYATWALGSVAFSPDGESVTVSPGTGYFVLDVATGALRASSRSDAGPIVLDIAYGWNGRRIVIAESGLGGGCAIGINGGSVAILDADTLAVVAGVAWREGYPYNEGLPEFRAAPTDDLVLVAGTYSDPALRAFRLSDGVAMAPPPPPIDKLPLAFLGDGQRVLIRHGAQLSIVRLNDGSTLASLMDDGLGDETGGNPFYPAVTFAGSADGRVVAIGGSDARLLRVWNGADDAFADVCATEADARRSAPSPSSLSADGDLLAVAWGREARILHRGDGAPVATLAADDGVEIDSVKLSPSGEYLLAGSFAYAAPPLLLLRTADGARAADLSQEGANGSSMESFVFSPDGQRLHAALASGPDWVDDVFDLASGGTRITAPIPGTLLGFSAGCPVYRAAPGIWRACGTKVDPAVGPDVMSAVLSPGGDFLATGDPRTADGGATIWRLGLQQPIATISRREDQDPLWDARESPVAMSRDGRLLLLGEVPGNVNCYAGPSYEVLVVDMQTGAAIDRLPPSPSSVDDDAVTIAYGPQLWCAR